MSGESARPRRSRKSIAFQPNAGSSKENAAPAPARSTRKSRSKSLGPGGLDALNAEENGKQVLKAGNGNGRRASLAPASQVRSILKPTLPVSPLKDIPAHRPRTQLRGAPPTAASQSQHAPPPPPPPPPSQPASIFQPPPPQPTLPAATVPLRTEEEQQRRAEILAARAARRQSLGNRRVSFAPEATLHTWDVTDYRGDGESTSSSIAASSRASTPASNRRNSSGSAADVHATPATPTPATASPLDHELPSTPPSQLRGSQRTSDAIPPVNFSNPGDDFMSSSPYSSSAAGDESAFVEMDDGSDHSDSTDSMDNGENPGDRTFVSCAGDVTFTQMDMDGMGDETAVQPVFKKPMQWRFEGEPTEPVSSPPALLTREPEATVPENGGGEMTMDVTKAVGGLLSPPGMGRSHFSFSPRTPQKVDDDDDDGEMDMDMTRPLGGLLQPSFAASQPPQEEQDDNDAMDFTRPVGGILNPEENVLGNTTDQEETVAMDMTRPVGGILSQMANKLRRSIGFAAPHLQPQPQHREEEDEMDMDVTQAIGGIVSSTQSGTETKPQPPSPTPSNTSEIGMHEDMTMEFTSVLGGIISQGPKSNSSLGIARRGGMLMNGDQWARDQAEKQLLADKQEDEMDMDMTVAYGGILPAPTSNIVEAVAYPVLVTSEKSPEQVVTYPTLPEIKDGDEEMDGMETSLNVDRIVQTGLTIAKPALKSSPETMSIPSPKTEEEAVPAQAASPTPLTKRSSRRSSGVTATTTPRVTREAHRKSLEAQQNELTTSAKVFTPKKPSPKNPAASVKTVTAKAEAQPKPPTPQSKAAALQQKVATRRRSVAPQKSAAPGEFLTPQAAPATKDITPIAKFAETKSSSERMPNPETPLRSISSRQHTPKHNGSETPPIHTSLRGVGFDKPGLGSPAISARLSRRKSISEEAMAFSPVALPSALIMTSRMDAEKRDREQKERKLRQEEEEKNMNLRSRIQLLTPRKQGRKSLAIGSMIPGKRALDSALESDRKRRKSTDGVSALFQGEEKSAPLKFDSALPPLSKEMSLKKDITPREPMATTSSRPSVETLVPQVRVPVSFGEDRIIEDTESIDNGEEENMTIQEFLDLINISFLDEVTDLKRHTRLVSNRKRTSADTHSGEATLSERIDAGACTAPMLEAFQHCCRELERHIGGGLEMIAEIENVAHEQNPLLFREYLDAPADIRALMDAQFRNIKTNARLRAKGDWYAWRTEILRPLTETLRSNFDGLLQDERTVEEHKTALAPFLPEIKQSWEKARSELRNLEELKKRIDQDDQEALKGARVELREITEKVETTRTKVIEKRQRAEAANAEVKIKEAQRVELVASIEEAERVKEMNRAWAEEEVKTWKKRCEELERDSGWSLSAVLDDGRMEMMFHREIKLLCDPEGKVPATVEYVPPVGQKPSDRKPLAAIESSFFIDNLNIIIAREPDPRAVLRIVSRYWKEALVVVDDVRQLRSQHYTEVQITDDGDLRVKATILIPELRSKMEIGFVVGKEDLSNRGSEVRVVYGAISQQAVQDWLMGMGGKWKVGVTEVVDRCLQNKRRGGITVGVKG